MYTRTTVLELLRGQHEAAGRPRRGQAAGAAQGRRGHRGLPAPLIIRIRIRIRMITIIIIIIVVVVVVVAVAYPRRSLPPRRFYMGTKDQEILHPNKAQDASSDKEEWLQVVACARDVPSGRKVSWHCSLRTHLAAHRCGESMPRLESATSKSQAAQSQQRETFQASKGSQTLACAA